MIGHGQNCESSTCSDFSHCPYLMIASDGSYECESCWGTISLNMLLRIFAMLMLLVNYITEIDTKCFCLMFILSDHQWSISHACCHQPAGFQHCSSAQAHWHRASPSTAVNHAAMIGSSNPAICTGIRRCPDIARCQGFDCQSHFDGGTKQLSPPLGFDSGR